MREKIAVVVLLLFSFLGVALYVFNVILPKFSATGGMDNNKAQSFPEANLDLYGKFVSAITYTTPCGTGCHSVRKTKITRTDYISSSENYVSPTENSVTTCDVNPQVFNDLMLKFDRAISGASLREDVFGNGYVNMYTNCGSPSSNVCLELSFADGSTYTLMQDTNTDSSYLGCYSSSHCYGLTRVFHKKDGAGNYVSYNDVVLSSPVFGQEISKILTDPQYGRMVVCQGEKE